MPTWSDPIYDKRKSELAGEAKALEWVRKLLIEAERKSWVGRILRSR